MSHKHPTPLLATFLRTPNLRPTNFEYVMVVAVKINHGKDTLLIDKPLFNGCNVLIPENPPFATFLVKICEILPLPKIR